MNSTITQRSVQTIPIRFLITLMALAVPGLACPSSKPVDARLSASPPAAVAPGANNGVSDVAEQAVKSVVNIASTRVMHATGMQSNSPFFRDPFFQRFFGDDQSNLGQPQPDQRMHSLGSGVIVSKDGLVITNNHVVDGADEIKVTMPPGKEFKAKVLGTDPKSDLAVIRLEGRGVGNLTPMAFGDSGRLRLGETVLAVGSPFGLSQTVTMGIVSAVGRANVGIADYEDFIQTDAAINPGNSGGALVNLRGELVGINTAIASQSGGYQGVGFAIPSNMAKAVMDSLIKTGKVERGWLGVGIQAMDENLSEVMHLGDSHGALVSEVMKDSPAARAGLERGDVVVRFNTTTVNDPGALRNLVAEQPAGTSVELGVLRNGKSKAIDVTIGEQPATLASAAPAAETQGALSGITVAPLDHASRARYHIPASVKAGVAVSRVESGSQADLAGLQVGDVIVELDRSPVASVEDFRERYAKNNGAALLLVNRRGATVYIAANRS